MLSYDPNFSQLKGFFDINERTSKGTHYETIQGLINNWYAEADYSSDWSTVSLPSTPLEGRSVVRKNTNNSEKRLYFYIDGSWIYIPIPLDESFNLNSISDVTINGTPADNELLAYNTATSEFINQTAAEAGLSVTGHTHDDRYYTESETDTLLATKSNTSHTHDDRYYTENESKILYDRHLNNFDSGIYYSSQAFIESEEWKGEADAPPDDHTTFLSNDQPFGKVALSTSYEGIISDFIPVQAGEIIYGEIWLMRETGASGTAGVVYYGVERYDKDKKAINSNDAAVYDICSNYTVPIDSTWYKKSGLVTLPLTHTPYSGSDGGAVRYVKVRLLINYNTGTIPTHWGGVILKRTTIDRTGIDVLPVEGASGANYMTGTALGSATKAFTSCYIGDDLQIRSQNAGWMHVYNHAGTGYIGVACQKIYTSGTPAATVDTDKFVVLDGLDMKFRTGSELLSDIGAAAVLETGIIALPLENAKPSMDYIDLDFYSQMKVKNGCTKLRFSLPVSYYKNGKRLKILTVQLGLQDADASNEIGGCYIYATNSSGDNDTVFSDGTDKSSVGNHSYTVNYTCVDTYRGFHVLLTTSVNADDALEIASVWITYEYVT